MTGSYTDLASIRRQALCGPDSGSRFAMDVLRLCDETDNTGTGKRRAIFAELHAERNRQDAKWGEQNHPVRKAEDAAWYKEHADKWRILCDILADRGKVTWFNIAIEEFFEAFAEDTPEGQRAELVQAAAVLVSIIECIDRNKDTEI
jgi:hypothetical protein